MTRGSKLTDLAENWPMLVAWPEGSLERASSLDHVPLNVDAMNISPSMAVTMAVTERNSSNDDGPGDGDRDGDNGDDSGIGVATRTRAKTKRPSLYRVLLLNDDYTPMEFVVLVLERFFNKGAEDATEIMLHVHQNGVGECGVYTYEIAETKVTQVMDFARKHQHPLQCVMEKK